MGGPEGSAMKEVGRDESQLRDLPKPARQGRVLDGLKHPLVAVKKLCKNGMQVLFDGDDVEVIDKRNGRAVLRGHCGPREADLCLIPISDEHQRLFPILRTNPTQRAMCAYEVRAVPALTQHLHACAGFPTKDRWVRAVEKQFFITWPGLAAERARKHLEKSVPAVMGHQRMIKQNARSTAKNKPGNSEEEDQKKSNAPISR